MTGRSRELDFGSLLAELDALVGERVMLEVAGAGHPVALQARGTLAHLIDFDGPSVGVPTAVFAIEGSGAWFSLRRGEIVSAHSYAVDALDGLGPSRHVQVFLHGGLELIVGIDRLGDLFDASDGC